MGVGGVGVRGGGSTSICGVTAITALAPAVGAEQRHVAMAVANVVAFGTVGMLSYPYLAHGLLGDSEQVAPPKYFFCRQTTRRPT